jgi:hypothetical protein
LCDYLADVEGKVSKRNGYSSKQVFATNNSLQLNQSKVSKLGEISTQKHGETQHFRERKKDGDEDACQVRCVSDAGYGPCSGILERTNALTREHNFTRSFSFRFQSREKHMPSSSSPPLAPRQFAFLLKLDLVTFCTGQLVG